MFRLKSKTESYLHAFLSLLIALCLSPTLLAKLFSTLILGYSVQVYAATTPLSGITDIAAGNGFSCAVTIAGKVRCWGDNSNNTLGDGTTSFNREYPSYVVGIEKGATAVAAGKNHACAIVDGGVKCWGNNASGQLGTGNTTSSEIAVDVSGLGADSGVTKIAVGNENSCVIINGGMKCWGLNHFNKLGAGGNSADPILIPSNVIDLSSGVTDIATGKDFTCAVVSGAIKCWGYNNRGQLGDGTTESQATPNFVFGITSGATAVSATYDHACAVVDGGVQCWGYNSDGQLGDGTTGGPFVSGKSPPVQAIPPDSNIIDVTAGSLSSCALFGGGALQCWGSDDTEQLANGAGGNQDSPDSTTFSVDITVVDSGIDQHRCAIVGSEVQCWGNNGKLQSGEDNNSSLPVIQEPQAILDNLCLAQSQVPIAECNALITLYVATEGHNWNNTNWLETDTPCSWTGVSCEGAEPSFVTEIFLNDNNNLTGIIPDLSSLDQLKTLDLSSNNLTGNLEGVAGLPELTQLYLGNNQLTAINAPLPTTLKTLELQSNNITGSIPSNLPEGLLNLNLASNQLTGEIPTGLPNSLSTLNLEKNALIGIIPDFPNLSSDNFGYNALTGAANPSSINNSSWADTQTVPVTNVNASVISATEVQLTWTPVTYTDSGYYIIRYGTSSGSYSNSVNTEAEGKLINNKNIKDLIEGTKYYFVIETYTPSTNGQANVLTSIYSEEVSVTPEIVCDPVVTNGNNDGAGSLRQAVSNVCTGSTITFADSMTINLTDEIFINKGFTIDGQAKSVVIDAGQTNRLFRLKNTGANPVVFKNLTLQNGLTPNITFNHGGAIYLEGSATAEVDQCLFKLNKTSSTGGGGAIALRNNNNSITVTDSTFDNNQSSYGGGAINVRDGASLSITNSTFINNLSYHGNYNGGALSITSNATATVTNSTFYNNKGNKGGAVYAQDVTLTINNVTFSKNDSHNNAVSGEIARGTSIYSKNTGLTINNSILANSIVSILECYVTGGSASGSNNIIEDGSCSNLTTSAFSVDPKLDAAPVDNGGLTETIALSTGSIAINTGNNSVCENLDQRGTERSGTCDIGAYEFISTITGNPIVNTTADVDDGDTTVNSLREAIVYATGEDPITFHSSLANNTITLTEPLVVNKDLTIDAGDQKITIDGNSSTRHFVIQAGTTIKGLTLTNGNASSSVGGSISVEAGSLTLENMEIHTNQTDAEGGAIYANSGLNLTISRSVIYNNQAGKEGGAIYSNGANLTLMNTTMTGNVSSNGIGGAIYSTGTTSASSTLINNTIAGNSSGIIIDGSILSLANTILANTTDDCLLDDTGTTGIPAGTLSKSNNNFIQDSTCSPIYSGNPNLGSLTYDTTGSFPTYIMKLPVDSDAINTGSDSECATLLNGNTDQRGKAREGSCDIGAYEYKAPSPNSIVDNLSSILDDDTSSENNSLLDAIYFANDGDTVTFDSDLIGQTITLTEEILIDKNITLDARGINIILDGSGGNESHRIFSVTSGNALQLLNVTLKNGSQSWGGLIHVKEGGTLVVSDSTLQNGTAPESGGGAIATAKYSNLFINGSTFNNNTSDWGGALNIKGDAEIINTTFFANSGNKHGGAIKIAMDSEAEGGNIVNLTYVTIADNSAPNAGGGIYVEDTNSTLNMVGVLLANNFIDGGDNDCYIATGGAISGINQYNLIENNECGITPSYPNAESNVDASYPYLATSLANNGGSTKTLRFQSTDSEAIDAIDATTCITLEIEEDQRGIQRPQGDNCDIGAYEQEFDLPAAPSGLTLDAISESQINLTWTDNSSDETGFRVFRDGIEIIVLPANTIDFPDGNVLCSTTYTYEVYATNGSGNSASASTASITSSDCTAPIAPSNLTSSAESSSQIRLNWTDNSSDETSLTLLRDDIVISILEPNITTYTDTNLNCGTSYTYGLYATNALGDSETISVTASSGECLDNSANPPNAPANLTAEAQSETEIYLTWLDDSSIEDNYTVLRNGFVVGELGANSTSFVDRGLDCSSGYTYSVFATNQYGESEYLIATGETIVCGSDPLPTDGSEPPPDDNTQNPPDSGTGGDNGDSNNGDSTDGTDGNPDDVTIDPTLNPPSNLSATLRPDNTVDLSWSDNSEREIGFLVLRNNQVWAELPENADFFKDVNIECGVIYEYAVVATDGQANSLAATVNVVAPRCNTDTSEPPTTDVEQPADVDTSIPAPHSLEVNPLSPSEVTLKWSSDDFGHTGFYIERNGISLANVESNTHSILDRGLDCEQPYTYSVQTIFGNTASEPSYASIVMPPCPTTEPIPDDTVDVDSEGNVVVKLRINTTGEGSVFECGQQCVQEYAIATEVFLIPNPAPDWEFMGWTGDCDETGRIVMNSSQQCTANFAPLAYVEEPVVTQAEVTLQLNVDGEGYIEDCGTACTYVYPHGTDVVLNAIPEQGWTFRDWRGACSFGHIRLDKDTVCTAIFDPLPELTEGDAPKNPDTIPIDENGQIDSGQIPKDSSVSNVHFVGNNQNEGLVSNVTIEEGAGLQGGRLSGTNVNHGTVEDVNIRPHSELEGGNVAGDIQNDGEMRDVTIEEGATVTGEGTLSGTIKNGGAIDDIVLGPDTVIIGGELRGVIVGDLEEPARIGDAKIENAVISNMCITPTVELGDTVTVGDNVTLPNADGNLTILDFCVYPAEVKQIDKNGLAERVEPAAFGTFTPDMMKELPPEDLAQFTEEDLAFLDINAAKQMTDEQFDNIPPESLKGLPPETLEVLPTDIVKDMTAEQVANLDKEKFKAESGDKAKQSRAATKLLTNISKQTLTDSGIDPAELLPEDWEIDPETQEIRPPAGTQIVYKSFELQDLPENLNMPDVPDFDSGFGIDGEGTPLIENLNDGLGQTQTDDNAETPVFRPEDLSKFRFKQKDNSILNVVGSDEFANFVFSFLPDTSSIQQTDAGEVDVGLSQAEGGFLQITMPNNQQFVMIPSPDKPDELHAIFGADATIKVNEKGDVFITYTEDDTVRFLIIMFDSLVDSNAGGEPLTFTTDTNTTRSRNSRAIREGRVVFSDGSAQNIYPAVLYPEVLIGLLGQIGATNVIYNVDGTFGLGFNGQTLTLLPTYDTQVQGLDVWERIDASISVEGNELVYTVQDTTASQLVTSRLVISF